MVYGGEHFGSVGIKYQKRPSGGSARVATFLSPTDLPGLAAPPHHIDARRYAKADNGAVCFGVFYKYDNCVKNASDPSFVLSFY